jgi:hypothetical protein
MSDFYDITNWYWSVQDTSPGTQVYSTASNSYVPLADTTYVAWQARGNFPTVINTQAGLYDVLNSTAVVSYSPRTQTSVGSADLALANPVPGTTYVTMNAAGKKVILPRMDTPLGIFIGGRFEVTNLGNVYSFDVVGNDGTTLIATVPPNGGYVSLTLTANNSRNGTILVRGVSPIAAGVPQCGRLVYTSATQLTYAPFNGNLLQVSGKLYTIPNAGIAGLANTGVFINNVAGQNLAASTVYLVTAKDDGSGGLVANFYTSFSNHSPSTATGNAGVEIITGADAFSVIGGCRTNASAQFEDTAASRCVLSWFNRRNRGVVGAIVPGATTTSSTPIEINSGSRAGFLCWANENDIPAALAAVQALTNTVNNSAVVSISLDGSTSFTAAVTTMTLVSTPFNVGNGGTFLGVPEGFHYITPMAGTSGGGTLTFFGQVTGMIRG